MIFEFFKKLFWKADESSRKRKSEFHEDEAGTFSKKSCKNSISSDELLNNNECISAGLDNVNMQSKTNHSSSLNSTNYRNNGGRKPSHDSYKLTNFTLYKAHQMIDRQKYSRMLLNFANPGIENFERSQQYSNKSHDVEEKEKARESEEREKYIFTNYNIGHELDLRNKSNNTLYSCNQHFLQTSHINSTIENSKFQCSHKRDPSFSTDSDNTYIVSNDALKTNTLKEQLAVKEVMKQNFTTQLTEKYNNSLEQRNREAEEIKKMTHILAKHNRLTREAALEDYLNRSLRLCEAILDEQDQLETQLPELDSSMIKTIDSALSSGPGNEVLVQEFGLKITRKDIQTLGGLNWLNDEVINFYMNLLITRGNSEKYPAVYAMNTFFYPKLVSGGHNSLKRWTRKIDIFSKDLLVVPIHLGIHWCMSIIDFRNKTIQYYDSMGSPNNKCLQVLKQYLQDESVDKKKKSFEFIGWNFECMKDIPQQMNGSDCGVFSCMFAEYICSNKKFNFSQEDMPYFRKKMVYEILTVQLL